MSNTAQNNSGINLNNQDINTFYIPSFGDEEFEISPITQNHLHSTNSHQIHHPPTSGSSGSGVGGGGGNNNSETVEMDQYQMPSQNSSSVHHSMTGLMEQNQYNLWNAQDTQQIYMNQNDYEIQSTNQMYYNDSLTQSHQSSPHQNMQQQQQTMMMMPPPQKSPQITSPMSSFIGQSPHGYSGENGTTSDDSDDSNLRGSTSSLKRPSPEPLTDKMGSPTSSGTKQMKTTAAATIKPKPKVQRKKKKKDPNEPQKPVSAYALFFRDTQAAIKGQNPNASFGEVSTIVASMWDVLAPEHKDVYKKKTEAAKIEYLKTLAAYRASVVSKGSDVDVVQQPQQHSHQAPQHQPQLTQSQQQQMVQSQHHSPQQQMPNMHPSQNQMSPPQHQLGGGGGLHHQQPMHHQQQQPNQQQFMQQSPHQMHNQYPHAYGNAYKSPPQQHTLDYNNQMSLQSANLHASHSSAQQQPPTSTGMAPHQMTGAGINSMNQLNYSEYNQTTTAAALHNPNMGGNLENNVPSAIYHHQHQPHHMQQQNLVASSVQQHNHHNQTTNHGIATTAATVTITGNGNGGSDLTNLTNLPVSGMLNTSSSPSVNMYHHHQQQQQVQQQQQCIRHGCTNQAIVSPDWEDEYCSNECVITHCGDVFGNWIQKNNQQQQTFSAVK